MEVCRHFQKLRRHLQFEKKEKGREALPWYLVICHQKKTEKKMPRPTQLSPQTSDRKSSLFPISFSPFPLYCHYHYLFTTYRDAQFPC